MPISNSQGSQEYHQAVLVGIHKLKEDTHILTDQAQVDFRKEVDFHKVVDSQELLLDLTHTLMEDLQVDLLLEGLNNNKLSKNICEFYFEKVFT
jgi:hypothetical protein